MFMYRRIGSSGQGAKIHVHRACDDAGMFRIVLIKPDAVPVRIFRIGPGSVMKAMSRMTPPQLGHWSGNSAPTRAMSFAQAIRDVSCERGF